MLPDFFVSLFRLPLIRSPHIENTFSKYASEVGDYSKSCAEGASIGSERCRSTQSTRLFWVFELLSLGWLTMLSSHFRCSYLAKEYWMMRDSTYPETVVEIV